MKRVISSILIFSIGLLQPMALYAATTAITKPAANTIFTGKSYVVAFGGSAAGATSGTVTVSDSNNRKLCDSPISSGSWACSAGLDQGNYQVVAVVKNASGQIVDSSKYIAVTVSSIGNQSAQASSQTLQTFNPNVQLNSNGGSFNGSQFSGVSGSILNCTNVTQNVAVSVGNFASDQKSQIRDRVDNIQMDRCAANKYALGCKNYLKKIAGEKEIFNAPGGDGLDAVNVIDNDVESKINETNKEVAKINKTNLCLNGIAYAVAKQALAQVANKTLSWVNTGGLYGGPLYITDMNSYLRQLTNTSVNNFLIKNQSKDPLFSNAIRGLVTISMTGINNGRLNSANNTQQGILYNNFQQDFTRGGWNSFLNMSYNPVGAVFNASNQLGRNIATQQQNTTNELLAGNGFLDVKRCKNWVTTAPAPVNYDLSGKVPSPYATVAITPYCAEWETTTPGSVVANQVATITTTNARQLELANSVNQVLGTFFDGLLNRFLSGGLAGINSKTPLGNYSFNNGSIINDNVSADLSNTENPLNYQSPSGSSSGYSSLAEFNISKPQDVRSVLKTQKDFLNASTDSYIALSKIVPTLGALDYCIPGPNPTWPDYLNENYSTFIGAISKNQKSGKKVDITGTSTTIGAGIGSVIPGVGTAIGAAVGAIVGVAVKLFTGNKVVSTFYSEPSVYDKVTDTYIDVEPYYFSQKTKRKKAPTLKGVIASLDKNYPGLVNTYQTLYNPDYIISAFNKARNNTPTANVSVVNEPVGPLYEYDEPDDVEVDTDGDGIADEYVEDTDTTPVIRSTEDIIIPITPVEPSYDSATFIDAFNETRKLVDYNRLASSLFVQYQEIGTNNLIAVAELEDINKEVQQIVKKAKARYIAEKGNSINLACLNKAYIIDETPVNGLPRLEPDQEDDMVKKSREANNYFYNKVLGIPTPAAPITTTPPSTGGGGGSTTGYYPDGTSVDLNKLEYQQ